MPRLTYFAGLALLAVAGAFLLTDRLLTPPPGVTEANVKRIREGMRLAEVEAILGPRTKTWQAQGEWAISGTLDDGVVVCFEAGRVSRVGISSVRGPSCWHAPSAYRFPRATPRPLDRLRAWLGW
jgi:hypothetical protein